MSSVDILRSLGGELFDDDLNLDPIDNVASDKILFNIEDTSDRFKVGNSNQFAQQYAQLYFSRLKALRGDVLTSARNKWKDLAPNQFLNEVGNALIGQECVIIGTIYKNMLQKPSALNAVEKDEPHKYFSNYSSSTDLLIIEDESSRITLSSDVMLASEFTSGFVVAVRGMTIDGPKFAVSDYCLPNMANVSEIPESAGKPISVSSKTPLFAIVAGLSISSPTTPPLYTSFLLDFLRGGLVYHPDALSLSSRVSRIIVAGDSLAWEPAEPLYPSVKNEISKTKAEKAREVDEESAALETADLYLCQLAATVGIELIPGEGDPCSSLLPQQPIHPYLLPMCRAQGPDRVQPRTNPFQFNVRSSCSSRTSGTTVVVVTQALDDVIKFTARGRNPLDALMQNVRGRLLAPSAPDTLACLPFSEEDPFIIAPETQVVIASCLSAKEAAWGVVNSEDGRHQKVLCVVVPAFCKSGAIVLFDPETLEVGCISANIGRLGVVFQEKSAEEEEREREEIARLNAVDIEMGEDE